ncbi:hypothetical protein OIE77_01290 [Streptomyces sp. NBC_01715]
MGLDGVLGHRQGLGYLAVGQAAGQQAEDLALTVGEPVGTDR